jgi:hypothetical protein
VHYEENVAKGYALDFGFAVFDGFMSDAQSNGGIFTYPSSSEEQSVILYLS